MKLIKMLGMIGADKSAVRFVVAVAIFPVLAAIRTDAAEYDYLVSTLTSDGCGYVDTGYRYHRSEGLKTKRIVLKLFNSSNGYKDGVTGATCDWFGVFGNGNQRHSYFRFQSGSRKFVMYGGGDANVSSTSSCYGDAEISLDYFSTPSVVCSSSINGLMTFSGESLAAPTEDATETFYLFGNHNYSLTDQAWNPSYYQLKEFMIYETDDNGETETLAHDFVPCCAEGRPALYDRITGDIRFPSTRDFVIPSTDVTVFDGRTMKVAEGNCTPKTLTLEGGATLVLSGLYSIRPTNAPVMLPESGVVTIRMAFEGMASGCVLIENLPDGWDVSKFNLEPLSADLLKNNVFTLSKDGDRLVLRCVAKPHPPVFGTLLSDGKGYIDTGYRYRRSSNPKTKRLTLKFYNQHNGARDGVTGDDRDFFGVYGANAQKRSYLRFRNGSSRWVVYGGGDISVYSSGECYGTAAISIDYFSNPSVFGASSISGEMTFSGESLAAPTEDATETFYLFGNHNYSLEDKVWRPSCFELNAFQIHETSDEGETETLVHDFVPARDGVGRLGIFDCVTGDMRYPIGVGTETGDGFVFRNEKWRLRYNGCLSYHPANEALTLASTRADGYLIVDDGTQIFDVVGNGSTYELTMPDKAVSFYWTEDLSVADGEVMSVCGTEAVRNLTLSAGSEIAISADSELLVTGDVILPAAGTVSVSVAGVDKSGDYVIMRGLTGTIDVSKFTVGTVGEKRYSATFEQVGSTLVVHVYRAFKVIFR